MTRSCILGVLLAAAPCSAAAAQEFERDVIPTSSGALTITFVGHGTLMFAHGGKVIHVDPVGREADYSEMPNADLVLVTHRHGDHLDVEAIGQVSTDATKVVISPDCGDAVGGAITLENGDSQVVQGFRIEAVPAYNIVHKRDSGQPYHPKGDGNGYVITFGNTRVFVAGDTENTPELMALENIDIAFLPMNLPYTMTPEMVADAAKAFRPRILYPYHYGQTDVSELVALLADANGIEVRVRNMQ
jgi:L-ascorbate metabolism protein UlaG (beta-lactamase superfamily)